MAQSGLDTPAAGSVAVAAETLVAVLRGYGRVAVAFSGGVDSTVVAKAAQLALGAKAVAVTGSSASLAEREFEQAGELARTIGIRHLVIATGELDNPAYIRNDGTRCYFCKSELYDQIAAREAELGFDVIASGANTDDLGDYRPGLVAAAERRIRHPLQEAGLGKEQVRELARYWSLPNWDKPAAPCLSSRLAVGVEVTPERLKRIERAEVLLAELGLAVVRVRYHEGDHARIEIPVAELSRLLEPDVRQHVVERFKELGFKFVSVDLEGFRSGALNVLVPVEMLRGRG